MMYNQGDILLIPIPFSDLSSNKKRPILVISSDNYNNKTKDILVAAITSNIENKDFSITIQNKDLIEGNLKVTSCIRTDKLYTLSQNIVIKKFGKVNNNIINNVKDMINKLIK